MSIPFQLDLHLEGNWRLDYEPKIAKAGLRQAGQLVKRESKKLIARKAVSRPGEFFGRDSGETFKSIYMRSSRSGFAVIVEPKRTQRMAEKKFYPTILTYGVQGRIESRKDPIDAAFEANREKIEEIIHIALDKALEFRASHFRF